MATLTKLIAGETFNAEVQDADATGIVVSVRGPASANITLTASGSLWTGSAATDAWPAGRYAWQAMATYAGSVKRLVGAGHLVVEANLANVTGTAEQITTAADIVRKIEAQLAGNAEEGVRRYRINNRELERYSVAELLQLLTYWKNRAQAESARERGGNPFGPRIAFRI